MTAQSREQLSYNDEVYGMAAEPLKQYLSHMAEKPVLVPKRTSCWRGYYGSWEIKENKLHLIDLKAFIESGEEVGIEFFFPGQSEVFADWFSGEIRVPRGEMLHYVHAGYGTVHEEDLFLEFNDGILRKSWIKNNMI